MVGAIVGNIGRAMLSGLRKFGGKVATELPKSLKTNYLDPIKKSVKHTTHMHKATPELKSRLSKSFMKKDPKLTQEAAEKMAERAVFKRNAKNVVGGMFDTTMNATVPYFNSAGKITKNKWGNRFIQGGVIAAPVVPAVHDAMSGEDFSENANFGITGAVAGTVIGGAITAGNPIGAVIGGLAGDMLQDSQEKKKKKKIIKEYLESKEEQFDENANFDLAQDMDKATVKVDTNAEKIQNLKNENKSLDNINKTTAVLEGVKTASRFGMEKNISKSQGEDKQTRSIIKSINKKDGNISAGQTMTEARIAGEINKTIRDNVSKMQENENKISAIKKVSASNANKNTESIIKNPITKNPGDININKNPITENPGNIKLPENQNTTTGRNPIQKLTDLSAKAGAAANKQLEKVGEKIFEHNKNMNDRYNEHMKNAGPNATIQDKIKDNTGRYVTNMGKTFVTVPTAAMAGLVTGGLPGAALGAIGASQGQDLKTSLAYGTAGVIGGSMINGYRKRKKDPLLYR